MKVMLTPPDLWGSTGYVSQSGADASDTMYKMRQSDSGDDLQWGVVGGSGENKEAVTENIILVNRQRQLEEDLMRARVSRKWYLVVIVLLYIGLLASFSLNVTLLMRKPVSPLSTPETHQGYGHGSPSATTPIAGPAPPTPLRTDLAPPAWTCASPTPAPSTPRRAWESWSHPITRDIFRLGRSAGGECLPATPGACSSYCPDFLFLRTARPPSLCPGLIRASPPPCSQAAAAPSTPSSSADKVTTCGWSSSLVTVR